MGPWFGLLTLRLRLLQWKETRDHFSELASLLFTWVESFLRLIYHLISRDIYLKSQEFSVSFPSHFNGFILFNLFRWIISFSHPFIPLIHAFIFPSCFIYYSVDFYLFNLFVKLSNSYLFIYSYLYIRIHSDIIIHLFIRILIGLALGLPFELFS